MASKSIISRQGEGEALWFLGGLLEIKVTSEDSGGDLVVVQLTVAPNTIAAPPHTHTGAETSLVLEGNLRYHLENKAIDCGPGTELYFHKGTWEWFENVSARPARVLITYAPGCQMDAFFREIGEVAASRMLPPPSKTPPDFQRISAVAKKYGMELRPPPEKLEQQQLH